MSDKNSRFELSTMAKDAFVILANAREIHYRDGDVWKAEEDEIEHPLVPRLRAASLMALTDSPSDIDNEHVDAEMRRKLSDERQANDSMREFLVKLEDIARRAGMPKTVTGWEVLAWLETSLSATGS